MPLHHYRVMPALAVAVAAARRPGEWLLTLRARSEASAVELRLRPADCAALGPLLLEKAASFASACFDLAPTAGYPAASSPALAPFDLEALVTTVEVLAHPARRLLGIRAKGDTGSGPFLAEVWGTPEQMLAVARQADEAARLAAGTCPTCGLPITGEKHICQLD